MELLHNFKRDGFFTSQLYHLISSKKMLPPDTEIIPSVYMKQLQMSTAERLQNLNGMEISNLVGESKDNRPVLDFSPKILVFQNYKINEKAVAKFTVRNISSTPTYLNMVFKPSSNFFIKLCGAELLSRLAPGIGATFAITFVAAQCEDYAHRVTFNTDKQQYVLSLIGMGPRPIYNFPDEIVVPPTPLKVDNSVSLPINNMSTMQGGFTLTTKCPFSIKPKLCYLKSNEMTEIKLTFKSMNLGHMTGKLTAQLETDERFRINVSGTTYTVSIELEKAVVRFLDTYNTMVRQQELKITNKSDQVITFICMKNDSVFNDFEDKIKLATIFYTLKDSEAAKYRKLVHYDVLSSEEHDRVYTRIFFDEIQSLVADESLFFTDPHFAISPIKGRLWPKESTSITILFNPKQIGDFISVAFLDIDGIVDRVPLTMKGTSLPPNIQLHVENLDMDNVYINKTYCYEIVAVNKGHINGIIEYKPIPSLFGSVITCTPGMHCLRPGEKQPFLVSFLNSNQGPYFEELSFQIRDTDVVRKLYLKGTIIYPTLTFSIPCLDFGIISVGIPKTLHVDAINESEVNVNATMKISSDGPEVSAITLEDCATCDDEKVILALPLWPKEFDIEPTQVAIGANSKISLRVTLTANLVRANQTYLELELDKSDSPPITLPITFEARVPYITPAPDINMRACFLNFKYSYDIVLSSNQYWGYYVVEETEQPSALVVNIGEMRGMIKPNTTFFLPLTLMSTDLGLNEYVVKMHLFGSPQSIEVCHIKALGVRPIITCMPMSIHWGQVKLLNRVYKTLQVCNDSPVTVYFNASILNKDARWTISPTEGSIDPEGEIDLSLSVCLIDAGTYTNKAVLHFEKVKDIIVPLSAVGVGTSIIVGKDRDHVNLGLHFVKFPMEVNLVMENCGTKLHSLEWNEHYKLPKTKQAPPAFFDFNPRNFKIAGGEKLNLKITGMSPKVGNIAEMWYLVGSVEGINKKELLMSCYVTGEFIEPKIILSTTQMNFQFDYGPYSEFYKLTDVITIKNVCLLPLHIDITCKPPFAIVHREGTYKIDPLKEDMCHCISYDESDDALQNILNEAETRVSKVFKDCITNKVIKRERQGPINFFQDIHKIKAAFNLTYTMDELMECGDIMKLQIVFDTTKHLNLKTKIYSDCMRIKFKGHKNKDTIKIVGEVNFPNVVVYTPRIDFQCLLNGSMESRPIKIHNPTKLIVCYKFKWKKCNLSKIVLPEVPDIEYYSDRISSKKSSTYDSVVKPTEAENTPETISPEAEKGKGESSQIEIIDPSPERTFSTISRDSVLDFEMMRRAILKKIIPMVSMPQVPEFKWEHMLGRRSHACKNDINELFQLIPYQGLLYPGETHIVHVTFRPSKDISVRGVLECEVLGGPSEYITVTGQSSDLIFKLNTQTVNFKIRSFHENATEKLIITNMAPLAFQYKSYLNEPVFENDLPATIYKLDPPEKILDSKEQINVSVIIRPGVVGYFNRSFLLEIGHLPHIPIEVFGWGVIPQVYIALPKPGLMKLNTEVGYRAIRTLTTEYLEAVSEIFNKGSLEYHINSPQADKCFEDPDFQYDWHICSPMDEYPSIMDIELAIERMQVVKYIKSRPEIMNMYAKSSKVTPIPGFNTTAYELDLGVIITGNTVQYAIDVTNYGPIPIRVHFPKNYASKLWFEVKLCGKLNPGETGKLEVKFSPTSQDFPEYEQYVEVKLCLEVPYGVSVPINVKSLCAVPFLKSNVNIVDFGPVRCGNKVIISIPLQNVGKPTCVWYAALKLKTPGPNPMLVLDSSGKYEPGQGGWLSISFKPTMEMIYEGLLIFRFHMNPNRMVIPVVGHGVLLHAHIIGPHLNFSPTLPWEETRDLYFGITNPGPFPIELIIAHVDEKWKEEEELYSLLYKYYNKPAEMLLPALIPGRGMPYQVVEFFERFKANVKKGLEEAAAARLLESKAPKKPTKSPKAATKSAKDKGSDKAAPVSKKIRSENEVIADEIKAMKEEGLDPLAQCLMAMDDGTGEIVDKYAKGLLLFFNGAPSEENSSKELACSLGRKLGLPTINFDNAFIEALLTSQTLAKTIILSAVDEVVENRKKMNKDNADLLSGTDIYLEGEHEDEFDILMNKMLLLDMSKANDKTPRSKTSDKKKKDVSTPGSQLLGMKDSIAMFQMDLIQELLTDYFSQDKFSHGFVMDSLTSFVIKVPSLVLTTTLRCKNTIYNVHLVLCHSDFNKWAQKYEQAMHEAEIAEEQITQVTEYTPEQIKNICKDFEDMDAEEYEDADPDLKAIFIKHGLDARRMKFYAKSPEWASTFNKEHKRDARSTRDVMNDLQSVFSDTKKRAKKDDFKGKPSPEYFLMQTKFNEYQKNVYENLVNIACNWLVEEGDVAIPLNALNGQPLSNTQKKIKKTKSDIQISEEKLEVERGFPLTLVFPPCLDYKEGLADMFLKCPIMANKLKREASKIDVLQFSAKKKEYSVLLPKTFPTIHYEDSLQWLFLDEPAINKCVCNQITDLNLLDDSTQYNVLNILSKWHCTCGKKVTSSRTSTSDVPSTAYETYNTEEEEEQFYYCPEPLNSVQSKLAPEGRIVLEPGDLVRCKYSFSPTVEGHFSIKRYVEVTGWPDSRIDINVVGICDIPRLDSRPKKMFADFVRRSIDDRIYKHTYLDDKKTFEFGPIFIGRDEIYKEEYTIQLKNCSLLTADVDIEFLPAFDVFTMDKDHIVLEPGCRDQLTITAAPAYVGDHNTLLIFCIKNNPEMVTINITCSGVVPLVEVLPLSKVIEYGKLLLYRRQDDRFIVKNDSVLPIMWKIRNPEEFMENFIVSQTSGIIPRNENHVVPVTYIACNVGVISQLSMIIDIYDELGRGEPMIVDCLWFSGECYDVMMECAYGSTTENFLNYGNVKVNSTVYRELYLLNRGHFNIYYKLKKVKNFPEPALLKSFTCTPDYGVIPPNSRLVSVEFECTPTTSMNLNNVPAYTCSLLDGRKEQAVIAKFPICITIASFYNTFTLFPLGELNFHIIPVGQGIMREVILTNTSKCPFNYEVIVPEKYREDPELALAQLPKGKDIKFKNAPLKCGNFFIVNEDNLLAPGASRTIQIQFMASAPITYEETIYFIVSDTCPAEMAGVPLRLVGTGAKPMMDFWNLENTFREHLIVKSIDEYKKPEPDPHCVFVEDTVTLHYYGVKVNKSYCGFIDLYNNGLVPCILHLKLVYQSNTPASVFNLDRYELQIDPLMHKRLGITFAPKELQEYRAVLELNLKLFNDQSQTFKLCLVGDGLIPRIRLLKPAVTQPGLGLLNFPVTCLGSMSNKALKFKNITTLECQVNLKILQAPEERPVFWLSPTAGTNDMVFNPKKEIVNVLKEAQNEHTLQSIDYDEYLYLEIKLKQNDTAVVLVYFNPLVKGRTNCDIKINIVDNPFEYFTIMCEAEAFVEDVMLVGLEMLSMSAHLEPSKGETSSETDAKKKIKSAPPVEKPKSKKMGSNVEPLENTQLKYILNFGGCELCSAQRRSVLMLNNSEKLYKFNWSIVENIVCKPAIGFIAPGEEKDIEIAFFSTRPMSLKKELLSCTLTAISVDTLTQGSSWDNRQVQTIFEFNKEIGQNDRLDYSVEEGFTEEAITKTLKIMVYFSVTTDYIKYTCDLGEKIKLKDTYIYQKRDFKFKVENVGAVSMKMSWNFLIEDAYPARIDKKRRKESFTETEVQSDSLDESNMMLITDNSIAPSKKEGGDSKETLFSGSLSRESVDTWFEIDLPFVIEPKTCCLKPGENQQFHVTFSPLEVFDFTVRLKSSIDNLDPYDQDVNCKIMARSLLPYVHFDLEESDYLTSDKRTNTMALPPHIEILEFNVLGSGCYKKSFNIINPTCEGYEFTIEPLPPELTGQKTDSAKDFVPIHCNLLKGSVEGGTSTPVTFTFAPTAPGTYESQWKFMIAEYKLTIPLMVVGIVREPDVTFVPAILLITQSLVGFTSLYQVKIKNNESEPLAFEYKGNTLMNESGKTPVIFCPKSGTLRPNANTNCMIYYTAISDGPVSFKIFVQIANKTKHLCLCVNALSHSIKPTVTYYIVGNEHVLDYDKITNIHLEQTASTYERSIPFKIKNDGTATFLYEWFYVVSTVKKYLKVMVEPKSGRLAPGAEVDCILHFELKTIPVEAYPVSLSISDGPKFQIYLYANIMKPLYHFSWTEYDFGPCIINAPSSQYMKNLAFTNDDTQPIIIDLATKVVDELHVDFRVNSAINPGERLKIPIYFRPREVDTFEFKLQFWVNTLCEEIITVRGEGVPLLIDLYAGCQKSFGLGPVRVGEKIVREIEVMNHSKVSIDCHFFFEEVYPLIRPDNIDSESLGSSICLDPNTPHQGSPVTGPSRVKCVKLYRDENMKLQIEKDIINALASVKVVPSRCTLQPHRKQTLKIQFKPIGLINELNVQLAVHVLGKTRSLVLLSGSATGLALRFSQNSLQFGTVRKMGCKVLPILLTNDGDFDLLFWWQPLPTDDFTITPMQGNIAPRTSVTFTVTFRPQNYNPFIKIWAILNVEDYSSLQLALYAACADVGMPQSETVYIECPVREVKTSYVSVTNPTDETWLVVTEMKDMNDGVQVPFQTLREFYIPNNSTFEIPIHFKPKTIGKHEVQVLYAPLGETALFVTVIGVGTHPNPNGVVHIKMEAKESHTESFLVSNISENPESYLVRTELVKVVPEKFDGYFEIKSPTTIKVWGETKATCRWTLTCYEECEMEFKVMFVNEDNMEYQFYEVHAKILPSQIAGVLRFQCRARESVTKYITIKNPLSQPTVFNISTDKLQCVQAINVNRNSDSKLVMTYTPLVEGEFEDDLIIENYLIGKYLYKVTAICKPAKEKYLEYTIPLGTSIPIRLRVTNKSNMDTTFVSKVNHPSVTTEREFSLAANTKGKFLTWFEPTELGVQNIRVSFSSTVAGAFVFNIKGIATPPEPQGPYEIKYGGYAAIKFKNVFPDAKTFQYFVDNDDFYLKSSSELIKSKRETTVHVYLIDKPNSGARPPGTLTIATCEPEEPKVSWTYFLQGIP